MLIRRVLAALAIPAAAVLSIAVSNADRVQSSDEESIRKARARSNQAIAAHDLPGIADAWMDDVHIVSSTSAHATGRDPNLQRISQQFVRRPDTVYVRQTTAIDLYSSWNVAAERGEWIGRWTEPDGALEIGGTYLAQWRKIDGRWLIQAELFVPIRCHGSRYCRERPSGLGAQSLAEWDLDGSGVWGVRGDVLVLEKAGVPAGPIRRPAALALLRGKSFEDVEFAIDIRSTAPADLAVRDVLLIVGYQSPSRFYYVHLSAKTDSAHNGIFLVDNADRRRIDDGKARARLTDQEWQRVRLVRLATTGSIQVFFGNETEPTLSAMDRTLTSGRVGVGSFDETAEFRRWSAR